MLPITITTEITAESVTLDRLETRRRNLDVYGQCLDKHDLVGDALNCQREHSSVAFIEERLLRARLEFLAWVDMPEVISLLRRGCNSWDIETSATAYQEGLRNALRQDRLVFLPEFIN